LGEGQRQSQRPNAANVPRFQSKANKFSRLVASAESEPEHGILRGIAAAL
jgi:hypothetical protein